MPLLIATDEAGYGPKLGPLVIVATAWRISGAISNDSAFQSLSVPVGDERCDAVYVDDSKRVFKRHEVLAPGKASMLEVVCRAASRWAALHDPVTNFSLWFKAVAATDYHAAVNTPWFADFADAVVNNSLSNDLILDTKLIEHWSSLGIELCGIRARFITAATFNQIVDGGKNKADILTESTCRLACEMIEQWGQDEPAISVFCDRHGGRAFYGAALQQVSAGATLRVIQEGKRVSEYLLTNINLCDDQQSIDWSFTVDGDSYSPVAMSSMIAKWLRERAMKNFNQYFSDRMPSDSELNPTAGYPLDADRFLQVIESAGLRKTIADAILIRKR